MQYFSTKVINKTNVNPYSLRIIRLREYFNLSQKDFAEKAGLTRGTISQIEIGKQKPTLENISIIAKTYHISFDYFFDDNYQLIDEHGQIKLIQQIPDNIKDLVHDNELLREKLERCNEALKWKQEKLSIVEEKLVEYQHKKKEIA